ncbi:hypothetical protein ACN6MT_19375 [Neobacillus niacini]|uniref:hypothetical protein n=1 Tax=Neobacillus niacini TaxID=86668 RepID=UPI003B012CE6
MSLEFEFVKVTNEKVLEFINQANHRILFVKPAFYKWEIETIINTKKMKNISLCEVYCEKGDEAIRFGFGDRDALDLIINNQNAITVQLVDSIRMSILIVDNNCLIYSPRIAQLDNGEKPSDFPNGFFGDKNVVEMIITRFPTYSLFSPEIDNKKIESISNPFDAVKKIINLHQDGVSQELKYAIEKLEENPPIDPSNLRKVNIYRNNYKILKRQLFGIKVKNKKINLKPFYSHLTTNKERLLSSWNIFTNDDIRSFQDMTFFEKELQALDKELLLDIGRFGLLIEASKKDDYDSRVNTMKLEFLNFLKGDINLGENRFMAYKKNQDKNAKSLSQVLEDSRTDLIEYLLTLAYAEKSFESKIFSEDRLLKREFENGDINKEEVYEKFIKNFVDNKLKFPNKDELLERIDIKNDFYDISDELLNNNEDFQFFIKKYDLDNLRKYNKGYEQMDMGL